MGLLNDGVSKLRAVPRGGVTIVTIVASSGLRVQNSTAAPTIALRWGGGYYRARGEPRDAVIQLTPEFGGDKCQTQSCLFLLHKEFVSLV